MNVCNGDSDLKGKFRYEVGLTQSRKSGKAFRKAMAELRAGVGGDVGWRARDSRQKDELLQRSCGRMKPNASEGLGKGL